MKMLRISVIVAVFSLATGLLAIQPKKGSPAEYFPEQSQEQLQKQQAVNGSEASAGVYVPDERKLDPLPDKREDGTASPLEVADQRISGQQALEEAEVRVSHKPRSGWSVMLWAVFLAIFGFGVVYGVRKWSANAMEIPQG